MATNADYGSGSGTTTTTPLYEEWQRRVLGFLPFITAPFSIVGSGLILYLILARDRRRKKTLQSTYHRLMLGLSSIDLLASLSMMMFGPWAVPSGTDFVHKSRGTDASCAAAGFLFNMTLGSIWYSTFLTLNFLLTIRFEVKERWIARRIEPFMHAFSITFPVVTGIYAVVKGFMNPLHAMAGYCYLRDNPPACSSTEGAECISGDGYLWFTRIIGSGSVAISFLTLLVSMVLISIKVFQLERRMKRYAGATCGNRRTKETAIQALLYIGACFLSFFSYVVLQSSNRPEDSSSRTYYFTFSFLAKFLGPLQGFFNALIYTRRRYNRRTGTGSSTSSGARGSNTASRLRGSKSKQDNASTATAVAVAGSTIAPCCSSVALEQEEEPVQSSPPPKSERTTANDESSPGDNNDKDPPGWFIRSESTMIDYSEEINR